MFPASFVPHASQGPGFARPWGAALQLCPPRTGPHRSTLLKLTVTSWTGLSPVCDKPDETPRGATVPSVSPSALRSVLTGLHGAVQLPCFLSPGCRPLRVVASWKSGWNGLLTRALSPRLCSSHTSSAGGVRPASCGEPQRGPSPPDSELYGFIDCSENSSLVLVRCEETTEKI